MWRSVGILAVLLAACATTPPLPVWSPSNPLEARLHDATVYVGKCGTGWLVDSRHVVTNRHVADCAVWKGRRFDVWVRLSDGRYLVGSIVSRSTKRFADLAIIELVADARRPSLALGDPTVLVYGDKLTSMGKPVGSSLLRPNTFELMARPRLHAGLDGVLVVKGTAVRGESG
jgi:S1-C subfamily serine protease